MFDWNPVVLSLRVALAALMIVFVTATLAARAMTRSELPGRDLLEAIFTLPLVLPPVVTGFFLLVLLGRRGPLGSRGRSGRRAARGRCSRAARGASRSGTAGCAGRSGCRPPASSREGWPTRLTT